MRLLHDDNYSYYNIIVLTKAKFIKIRDLGLFNNNLYFINISLSILLITTN